MKIKTTHLPQRISLWLLNRKWLWISSKIPFTTYDSMDIDKTITNHKGYKHFVFRGCVACVKFTDNKDIVLKGWFLWNKEKLETSNK
jgi:hypothetical protein